MPCRSRAVLAPTKTRMNGLTTGWPPTASPTTLSPSRATCRILLKSIERQSATASPTTKPPLTIGRAPGRERVVQYVEILVVAVPLKKQQHNKKKQKRHK